MAYGTAPSDIVRADDPLKKFKGRLVSIPGWGPLPLTPRYVSIAIFMIVFPIALMVDKLITGSISMTPLVDIAVAAYVTHLLANYTTGEVGFMHLATYAWRGGRMAITARRRPTERVHVQRCRAQRWHRQIAGSAADNRRQSPARHRQPFRPPNFDKLTARFRRPAR